MRKVITCTMVTWLMMSAYISSASTSSSPVLVKHSGNQDSNEEWIHSHKEDDIETFYSAEKIGTDKYEVRIRVYNGRSKPIRVWVRINYKSRSSNPEPVFTLPPPRKSSTVYGSACRLTVSAHNSRTCEAIKVSGEKIKGVEITRWVNEDVAKEEDRQEKDVQDAWKPRKP